MIHVLVLHSVLETEAAVRKRYQTTLDYLESHGQQLIVLAGFFDDPQKLPKFWDASVSGLVLAVGSGGTEELIGTVAKNNYSSNTPLLLWANSLKNSLPAALEAHAYLKKDYSIHLFLCDFDQRDELLEELQRFERVCHTLHKVNTSVVGSFGAPSSWLLTSLHSKQPFGSFFQTQLKLLETAELAQEVSIIPDAEARPIVDKWQHTIGKIQVSETDLMQSAKVYVAMKHLIAKHDLSAVTIRCFDLLELGYTACMGMSLCNDEQIVAGCEADWQTTLTMMVATYLTRTPVWMANPSKMHKANNTITFAHCTIASSLLKDLAKSTLQSHMESHSSTAIQGPLHTGPVTILRVGGANYDKMTIATGQLIDSDMHDTNLCRTQAVIRLDGSVATWMEQALGNHHVIAWGDHKDDMVAFGKLARLDVIEI